MTLVDCNRQKLSNCAERKEVPTYFKVDVAGAGLSALVRMWKGGLSSISAPEEMIGVFVTWNRGTMAAYMEMDTIQKT